MFARLSATHRVFVRIFISLTALWLAACDTVPLGDTGGGSGPDASRGVQVALLVPGGSGSGNDALLAQNLENAARLAIADLNGPQIDLRVYNTAGSAAQAAQVARAAVDDGADIILGPLYAEAANAAGVAVADRGINILSFSNTPTIAGGNVFVLGSTFQNTANRLVRYASGQGINRFAVVHANDVPGELGRQAITTAVQSNGGQVAATASYPLSQQGITSSAQRIASSIQSNGAQAVFMTAGVNADLPIIATSLPEAGVDPSNVRYIGLTRWNALPQALALPGLQGGLFALPDQSTLNLFQSRYAGAYGSNPHPLAGLAYDGIAAIGALASSGNGNSISRQALTSRQGFSGTSGVFRFTSNGLSERSLAVATIRNNQVVILDPAPKSFGRAGF